jgi:hypothetical protein
MYGNKNFHHIRDFMLEQKDRRPTWFYPETSYFIALDIDVPLLLTDYLVTRAEDTKFLAENNIEGQLNFSTGQEVGYWLMDWTFALLNNRDYAFDPLIGVKLLGEDVTQWKKITDFQTEYFTKKHAIGIVTFADFGTELMPGVHQILKRNMLSDLKKDHSKLQSEIALLQETVDAIPQDATIKDPELKALWNVTKLRVLHAYHTRQALNNTTTKETFLKAASQVRSQAQAEIDFIYQNYNRYPEAKIFEANYNPTAYGFGYAYTVRNLYYWNREEESIRNSKFSFSFMPLYGVKDVLRGWVF